MLCHVKCFVMSYKMLCYVKFLCLFLGGLKTVIITDSLAVFFICIGGFVLCIAGKYNNNANKKSNVNPTLAQCWTSVAEDGPAGSSSHCVFIRKICFKLTGAFIDTSNIHFWWLNIILESKTANFKVINAPVTLYGWAVRRTPDAEPGWTWVTRY